ncbi:DsbA family oxidoreductase [Streptomyces sp. NPDC006385]|uniref:DsbA family oxidoreductase n=1 Tax=Streptomyces sp. NPDC006385 TaxID=3156761 RepID=UPI0033AE77AA
MKIEIFSDVLCPWCYIGKRRIRAALEAFAHRDRLEVVWRSFELAPELDRTPGVTAAQAMEQWMDPAAVPARVRLIKDNGRQEGLELNLERSRPISTFDAHRLSHLAAHRGQADEILERLFHAYHTEAVNVADHDVLARLAVEEGLDAGEVRALLDGDAYADDVRADERRARALGVSGVPSVVVDGMCPVPGVMPPAELASVLEQAWARGGGRAEAPVEG